MLSFFYPPDNEHFFIFMAIFDVFFSLPGLSGDPSLVDLGGVPYLIPSVRRDKIYDLAEIPSLIDFRKNESDSVMMIGAGAGPWFHVGTNCELMLNLSISGRGGPAQDETGVRNFSRLATVHQKEHRQQQLPADQTKCALLVNFLVSKGEMSKVLRVECSKRTGSENFITCIRQTLNQHYPDKAIGTFERNPSVDLPLR